MPGLGFEALGDLLKGVAQACRGKDQNARGRIFCDCRADAQHQHEADAGGTVRDPTPLFWSRCLRLAFHIVQATRRPRMCRRSAGAAIQIRFAPFGQIAARARGVTTLVLRGFLRFKGDVGMCQGADAAKSKSDKGDIATAFLRRRAGCPALCAASL